MAELLSPNEIFYTAYEPKMANRFIMYVEGIPSYLIKAASRPSIDQGEVILDHINVERKLKGKSRYLNHSNLITNTLVVLPTKVRDLKLSLNLYRLRLKVIWVLQEAALLNLSHLPKSRQMS